MRLESTFERISNLQKNLKTVPLGVAKPQLVATQVVSAHSLQNYMRAKCHLYSIADAQMCSIDTSLLLNTKLQVGHQVTFTLTLRDSKGSICGGVNRIDIDLVDFLQGKMTNGNLQTLSQGQMKVTLTPERRGLHQLNVKVNGAHIKNSPFTVTVYMPPKLMSKPVATISGLARPECLAYSQTEDKVLAALMDEGTVVKVDTQLHLIHSKFIKLPRIAEITQDAALNTFFATTTDNQLHKLSNNGRIIKTVGRLGKGVAEFNRPNGLRMSKNHELYVCDSSNNRVQIFDRDLSFKRSFGKEGPGKGQFNFPSDVEFDSNGNIYISDHQNYRIQVFSSRECHIRTITSGIQFRPASLLIHGKNVYVTDWHNHRVLVMNTLGELIATFGGGYLRKPEGIAMDKAGFVYVTSDFSKIVVF